MYTASTSMAPKRIELKASWVPFRWKYYILHTSHSLLQKFDICEHLDKASLLFYVDRQQTDP